jgi:hypothetical protein
LILKGESPLEPSVFSGCHLEAFLFFTLGGSKIGGKFFWMLEACVLGMDQKNGETSERNSLAKSKDAR